MKKEPRNPRNTRKKASVQGARDRTTEEVTTTACRRLTMQSTYTNFANFFIAVHEESLAPAAAGSQPLDAQLP